MDQRQLTGTCRGIQTLYRARLAGHREGQASRERFVQKARDIRAQIVLETDPQRKLSLKQVLSETVHLLSETDRKIETARQQLASFENDYQFNQCSVLTGPID